MESHTSNTNRFMWIAAILLFFIGILLLNLTEQSHRIYMEREQSKYCEMVTIYIQSDGEFGWPDYKNIYEKECSGNDLADIPIQPK